MAPALTKLMCCALVDAGADINAQDEVHKTSSRHAYHSMRSIMIHLWLLTQSGWTPLMAACVCGHAAGVRCLLTLGADVNIPTKVRALSCSSTVSYLFEIKNSGWLRSVERRYAAGVRLSLPAQFCAAGTACLWRTSILSRRSGTFRCRPKLEAAAAHAFDESKYVDTIHACCSHANHGI